MNAWFILEKGGKNRLLEDLRPISLTLIPSNVWLWLMLSI